MFKCTFAQLGIPCIFLDNVITVMRSDCRSSVPVEILISWIYSSTADSHTVYWFTQFSSSVFNILTSQASVWYISWVLTLYNSFIHLFDRRITVFRLEPFFCKVIKSEGLLSFLNSKVKKMLECEIPLCEYWVSCTSSNTYA